MKGKWRILCAVFLCCWLCAIPVKAVGDGNVDGGGKHGAGEQPECVVAGQ